CLILSSEQTLIDPPQAGDGRQAAAPKYSNAPGEQCPPHAIHRPRSESGSEQTTCRHWDKSPIERKRLLSVDCCRRAVCSAASGHMIGNRTGTIVRDEAGRCFPHDGPPSRGARDRRRITSPRPTAAQGSSGGESREKKQARRMRQALLHAAPVRASTHRSTLAVAGARALPRPRDLASLPE